MSIDMVSFDAGETAIDWRGLLEALKAGHALPKAELDDTFLYRGNDTLLSRAAWIDGMGIAVKSATVFPGNKAAGKPMVNGAVNLYADSDGMLEAIVDFHLVTKWKTAGDSLYSASMLARKDAREFLIVGAGTVGRSMIEAYGAIFEGARFSVWNRTRAGAEALAAEVPGVRVFDDLQAAVGAADVICCATMASEPVIKGAWLKPGQHLDLIGAYRPDMREVDDEAMQRARVFVDSYDTTLEHIGELIKPLASGAIAREDVLADFYDPGAFRRESDEEITIAKNGGGAHLDLMVARYILEAWKAAQG
ncbi:ornithine cyclodeaminase family protein [Rhodalgimonas zhirmunskyi]|uniref:Ornithine cyclodeaminase n=1 Tax=Rhodalgimonas zhirmunskyi TaxID=2964767 RepID=A0AAJ1UAP0_9RHOB|nr:ornithine cyclodeaminase [Rhodoalgimonas zhirmunskyi]MDQ2095930.1 ornithine cyclodeaminase [Rhodoalgimonas zhirmunskyi]